MSLETKTIDYDKNNLTCLFTEQDWKEWYQKEAENKLWEYYRYYCIQCKIKIKNHTPLYNHLMNAHNYSQEASRIIINEIDGLNDNIKKFRKIYLLAIENDNYEIYDRFIDYRKNNPIF